MKISRALITLAPLTRDLCSRFVVWRRNSRGNLLGAIANSIRSFLSGSGDTIYRSMAPGSYSIERLHLYTYTRVQRKAGEGNRKQGVRREEVLLQILCGLQNAFE